MLQIIKLELCGWRILAKIQFSSTVFQQTSTQAKDLFYYLDKLLSKLSLSTKICNFAFQKTFLFKPTELTWIHQMLSLEKEKSAGALIKINVTFSDRRCRLHHLNNKRDSIYCDLLTKLTQFQRDSAYWHKAAFLGFTLILC